MGQEIIYHYDATWPYFPLWSTFGTSTRAERIKLSRTDLDSHHETHGEHHEGVSCFFNTPGFGKTQHEHRT
jgi:hypothetical protein